MTQALASKATFFTLLNGPSLTMAPRLLLEIFFLFLCKCCLLISMTVLNFNVRVQMGEFFMKIPTLVLSLHRLLRPLP